MHSEDMRARNMKYVPFGKSIPAMSKTASLLESIHETDVPDPVEGAVDPEVWFEKPYYRKGLWEEAMLLGNTGLVLTYITLEDSE
jgi:hypothetical protein